LNTPAEQHSPARHTTSTLITGRALPTTQFAALANFRHFNRTRIIQSFLLQQVKEAEQYQKMLQDQGNDLEIILGYQYPKDEVGDYLDSSPPPPNLVDSSDVESDAGSIDSIQRNADFVAF
jgi:hypothetical protein